jgi:hypothetical protein
MKVSTSGDMADNSESAPIGVGTTGAFASKECSE